MKLWRHRRSKDGSNESPPAQDPVKVAGQLHRRRAGQNDRRRARRHGRLMAQHLPARHPAHRVPGAVRFLNLLPDQSRTQISMLLEQPEIRWQQQDAAVSRMDRMLLSARVAVGSSTPWLLHAQLHAGAGGTPAGERRVPRPCRWREVSYVQSHWLSITKLSSFVAPGGQARGQAAVVGRPGPELRKQPG